MGVLYAARARERDPAGPPLDDNVIPLNGVPLAVAVRTFSIRMSASW